MLFIYHKFRRVRTTLWVAIPTKQRVICVKGKGGINNRCQTYEVLKAS
jgi:hypothetical protein